MADTQHHDNDDQTAPANAGDSVVRKAHTADRGGSGGETRYESHDETHDALPVNRARDLMACPGCDLLQRAPLPDPGEGAQLSLCVRCGAVLWRHAARTGRERSDGPVALALSALVLFVLANAFPLATMDIQGFHTATTLTGMAQALMTQGMPALAGLVFFTMVVAPAVQIGALCHVLLASGGQSLRHPSRTTAAPGRTQPAAAPRHVARAFWLLPAMRPWSMVEVFMLGALVSLVKLGEMATVIPGVALVSLGALMLVMAATTDAFDTREFWAQVEARPLS